MTPEERNMLTDLANKIAQTPAPPKDAEADEFIRTRIGSRPDALYLMTQTVLIQNMALQQAQKQIQELQQRAPVSAGGSFLGQGAGAGQGGGYSQSPYSGQQAYSTPPPQYAPPPPSGAPSFLRGAAQTAAGVAAGALAFEGIRSLFEHPGYGGGFGGYGGGFGGAPVEETVVNNYYDSPGGNDYRADNRNDYQANDDRSDYVDDNTNIDDSAQYEDTSDIGDDGGGFDDSGSDFV